MNNPSSKSGLVGVLSFLVLTAASLGILGAASRDASASPVSAAPSGVVRDGGEPALETVWTVDEVTVTPAAPAPRRHAAVKTVITASSDVCHTRPSDAVYGTTVRMCTPADMIGQ